MYFYNKNKFENISDLNFLNNAVKDKANKFEKTIEFLMHYIDDDTLPALPGNVNPLTIFISSNFVNYMNLINKHKKRGDPIKYEEFIEKSVDTIDSYGLGVTLLYVMKNMYRLMDSAIVKKLQSLFVKMIHPNLQIRIHINDALKEYESIISSYVSAVIPPPVQQTGKKRKMDSSSPPESNKKKSPHNLTQKKMAGGKSHKSHKTQKR
jgi:hypothetical protein